MLINADFSKRAQITLDEYQWVASPQQGVERVMMDRVGEEKARATSIVRYAPGSYFPVHEHAGGEEILVLSGTFSEGDEHFPEGWYLRNPPGSSHQPSSCEGAVIFVKLGQMPANETRSVRINTRDSASWQYQNGRETCALFSDANEQVSLQRLKANDEVVSEKIDGTEILLLEGELMVADKLFGTGSWIRLPAGEKTEIFAGNHGATIYIKEGHLAIFSVRP